MALFEGAKTNTTAGKTFSRLVVSDGFAPADKWLVDETLPTVLPDYDWGGIGEIVIPKGIAVGVTTAVKDPESGKYITVLTIADGTTKATGIAPYNIMRKANDRLYHNLPSMITRDYIELPYFTSVASVYANSTPAKTASNILFPWGCAYGTLAVGDYVTVDAGGRLIKLTDPDAKFTQIVGQVLAMDTDIPPAGWLKWLYQEPEMNAERRDDANFEPAPGVEGYGYDPAYKEVVDKISGRGIKGLTDGGGIGRTAVTAEEVATAVTADAGTTMIIRLDHPTPYEGTVKIYSTDAAATPVTTELTNFTVNLDNGWITLTFDDAQVNCTLTADYDYQDFTKAGTPTSWDFEGAAGAVRILLKF